MGWTGWTKEKNPNLYYLARNKNADPRCQPSPTSSCVATCLCIPSLKTKIATGDPVSSSSLFYWNLELIPLNLAQQTFPWRIHVWYIWCAMDPINIPPMNVIVYIPAPAGSVMGFAADPQGFQCAIHDGSIQWLSVQPLCFNVTAQWSSHGRAVKDASRACHRKAAEMCCGNKILVAKVT